MLRKQKSWSSWQTGFDVKILYIYVKYLVDGICRRNPHNLCLLNNILYISLNYIHNFPLLHSFLYLFQMFPDFENCLLDSSSWEEESMLTFHWLSSAIRRAQANRS